MNSIEHINWEQFSLVVGEDNEPVDDEMKELYGMFLDDAGTRLRALNERSAAYDPVAVAKEAHKIRGAASSFGFDVVAGLLATVETRINELSQEQVGGLLADALRSFEQSVREVKERHPALAA